MVMVVIQAAIGRQYGHPWGPRGGRFKSCRFFPTLRGRLWSLSHLGVNCRWRREEGRGHTTRILLLMDDAISMKVY